MLCDSVKSKDPMKVGRFGLGFKSVFHVTGKDATVILLFRKNNKFKYLSVFTDAYQVPCDIHCERGLFELKSDI